MKYFVTSLLLSLTTVLAFAQKQERKPLDKDLQIKIALQAAPADQREGAKVLGYNEQGELVTLREGDASAQLICLAPDYKLSVLYAYAYPKNLEPFMARGRELIAAGKRKQRDEIREAEFKAGKLSIPQTATILYGYWGPLANLDNNTGEIANAKRRYVIYMPYAKAADIGLSNKAGLPGIPWLMDEGSYKAHIMINPEDMGHTHGK